MNKKKFFPFFLTVILVTVIFCSTAFTGCGSSSDSGGGSDVTTSLTGTVTDAATEAAVNDASVKLDDKATTTDSDGYYYFSGIAAGTYTLAVTITGYQSYQESITIIEGSNTKNIALTPEGTTTGTLRGTVKYGETLLEGVVVELQNVGSYTTAEDGVYLFEGVNYGTYTVTAVKTGYNTYSSSVTISASTNTHNISMSVGNDLPAPEEGKGHITGYLTDKSGNPLENVYCALYTLSGRDLFKATVVYTDANGRYVFLNVNPGNYQVAFSLSGYYIPYITATVVSNGVTDSDVTVGEPVVDDPPTDNPNVNAKQYLYGGDQNDGFAFVTATSDGGCIAVGVTESSANGDVKGASKGSVDAWVVKMNSSGIIEWEKNYGGSNIDEAYCIQQTSDGGYIFAGFTKSSASGDVTGLNKGGSDIWVVKLDASGNITWQKNYGGDQNDEMTSIRQTSDGGYICSGYTSTSANGDVTDVNHGSDDIWVVKLDGSGNISWNKSYGGNQSDKSQSIILTSDGGYIFAGSTDSSANGDISGASKGGNDIWIVKLNNTGNITWEKNYGGNASEGLNLDCIKQTTDGGYIVLGYTSSSADGDITGVNKGSQDFWVMKMNNLGAITWEKNYGGNNDENSASIYITSDGGYLLLGYTKSSANGDVTGTNNGNGDAWIVKINNLGTIQWQYNYGGDNIDILVGMVQFGGKFLLSGYSMSSDTGTIDVINHGSFDAWMLKLDSTGIPTN